MNIWVLKRLKLPQFLPFRIYLINDISLQKKYMRFSILVTERVRLNTATVRENTSHSFEHHHQEYLEGRQVAGCNVYKFQPLSPFKGSCQTEGSSIFTKLVYQLSFWRQSVHLADSLLLLGSHRWRSPRGSLLFRVCFKRLNGQQTLDITEVVYTNYHKADETIMKATNNARVDTLIVLLLRKCTKDNKTGLEYCLRWAGRNPYSFL